jgi:hypothetical protein
MSSNYIYDAIEDEMLKILEEETVLPESFEVRLPVEAVKKMCELGLVDSKTNQYQKYKKGCKLCFDMFGKRIIVIEDTE